MPISIMKSSCLAGLAGVLAGCMSTSGHVSRNLMDLASSEPVAGADLIHASAGSEALLVYLTGYSYWDNTPPGSAQIARPVVHHQAGGTGTYSDPITVAVGHSKTGGRSRMDFPAGTRFYFPKLQKYGVVEDLCGDGPNPQNGPCHSGYRGLAWLDIYVGGRKVGVSAANRCMNAITGIQDVILNPRAGLPVRQGEIAQSTCRGI